MKQKIKDLTYNEVLSLIDITKQKIDTTVFWKTKNALKKYYSKLLARKREYEKGNV